MGSSFAHLRIVTFGGSSAEPPVALLMLQAGINRKSYFHLHANKHNDNLRDKVADLRRYAGISGNRTTLVTQLRTMASSLDFSAESEELTSHEKVFNNGSEFIDTNLNHRINAFNAMKSEIEKNGKIVFLVKDGSKLNPLPAATNPDKKYSHFLLMYKIREYDRKFKYGDNSINKGYIYLLDPWTGSKGYVSKKDFLDSVDLSNNKNDYLIIK